MFKYCSLYSSSSGNCFLVQSDTTNLIIDAGVTLKKIVTALDDLHVQGESIDAILITHDHIDHTRSIAGLSNKYNIPVYANKKTWNAIESIAVKIPDNNKKVFVANETFSIGDIKVLPFHTPHDAAEPCGFNLYCNNKKISIATDIGFVSEELLGFLKDSSCILLEANYDPEILKCSSYPYMLKQRIASNQGHLSNISAAKTLSTLYESGLQKALLVHLSKENNFPELAYETIRNETKNCKNLSIDIAPRDKPTQFFDVV